MRKEKNKHRKIALGLNWIVYKNITSKSLIASKISYEEFTIVINGGKSYLRPNKKFRTEDQLGDI